MRRLLLATVPLLLADAPPQTAPAPLAPAVQAMLDAAMKAGSEADVATIVRYAIAADPAAGATAAAIAQAWRDERAHKREAMIREAGFLDLWSAKAELGGSFTTGNSDTAGLNAAIDLTRDGLRWRQKVRGQFDYQQSQHVTTREHYLLDYEPNYKVSDRAYVYGQAQYESDQFLGYDDRLSTSVGAGYSAVRTPRTRLDLELGPAYRHTAFTDDTVQDSLAARGSLDFAWKLTPALSLSQAASAYVQRFNSTVTSATALNAKLFGPLSAQLSYNVQYESMPPAGSVATDTTGRAALVYSF